MSGSSSSSSFSTTRVPSPTKPKHDPKYEVFLSFRGEDTRDNFTSHLYAELCRKKIETFIDYRLSRGDEISPSLYTAIEESMVYVIIFSQHYASSTWCLDELTKILECKNLYGRPVMPVFFKVDPSSVRHQRGSFADAFVNHELRFKDDVIQRWKAALTEAAGLSGWDSQVTRPESMLVAGIVEDILRKLNGSSLIDNHGMIGIEKHVAHIQSLLHLESAAVRIVGIWGMGGTGKTTLARALYHKLAMQFSCRSLVVNAQQEIERDGTHGLRNKILSEIGEEASMYKRLSFSNERLKPSKILLIIDDVNNSGQLQELIRGCTNFDQGSRIIVTSRDMQVLKNAKADEIYEVQEMNFQDSLQLFSLNAFHQNYPIETYTLNLLVEKVLKYAKGIPLALKVLGSFLYGRTRKAWESELHKLERLPDREIFNMFKLSYDTLDEEQQDIFLDIACFYRGDLVSNVLGMLDGFGFSAYIGIDVLKDRCLISIMEGRIVMHDLIWEMGKEIVRQQCVRHPEKRSRLWKHEEIYHVLRWNKGTDAIECIFLDMCKIKKVQLHSETFKNMTHLRMLQFYKTNAFWEESNVILPAFLESLPDNLKVLRWDGFPQRYFPQNFCPENLVKLDMRYSNLEQLWEEDQDLPNLKRLDLCYSRKLIRIPNLCKCPNIEELILSHCKGLLEVYSSSILSKLNCLCLNGCVELTSLNLPSNILSRSSGLVVLHKCHKLKTFSISSKTKVFESHGHSRCDGFLEGIQIYQDAEYWRKMTLKSESGGFRIEGCSDIFEPTVSLDRYRKQELVDGTYLLKIDVVRQIMPSLFPSLHELCSLDLGDCESLTSLPPDICKLKMLRRLHLNGCSNLEKFPEIQETMENLAVLVLDETAIQELPSSLHHLVRLEELSLCDCSRLEIIPFSIGSLTKLQKLNLTCCGSLETFPSSIFKLRLTKLELRGCSKLKAFPEILEPAESFVHINLTETAIKELPSSLDCLVGLQTLCLNLCRDLESLPNSIGNLSLLSKLDCSGCGNLTEIPNDIGCLSSLRELSLQETGIVNLPGSIAHLSSLESLDVSDCRKLKYIPQLPPFLKQLLAFDCPSIRRVMSNSRFKDRSDSKKGTFKIHFTNNEEQDPTAHSDVSADARLRILEDAYRSVFYCFPGSAVPDWFPCRHEGKSVTVDKDSLNWCDDNRLIGCALCVVLRLEDTDDSEYRSGVLSYRITFKCYGRTHILPIHDQLNICFCWKGQMRYVMRDHTLLWKYYFSDSASINNWFIHAPSFTFEIIKDQLPYLESSLMVKECGILPLYTKEKEDSGVSSDYSSFLNVSNNDIEESSGSKTA